MSDKSYLWFSFYVQDMMLSCLCNKHPIRKLIRRAPFYISWKPIYKFVVDIRNCYTFDRWSKHHQVHRRI